MGRVIAQQDARGYLTSFVFDAAGRQLAVVDASGHRTSNLYDARGMVQATQDPLGALTSYAFDGAGNTVLRVDARSWPTTFAVDALNRVTGQLYLDGTRVTFTFDGDGRQATTQDVTGVTTLQYDAAGRQTGVVNGIGKALAYSFDAAGNRTVLVDPDGGRTTYTYDAQSRVTGIVNPWNERTTLSYDALDRETQRVLGSGTAISRGYDAAGRETLISSPVAVYTASYDAVGNRTSVVELDGTRVTYSYDSSYQLTREQRSGASAIDESFAYDGLGNRLTKTDASGITTCTYDAANALITSTAPSGVITTSSYDPSGNLTLENAGGALTTYTWDAENHLLSVASSGGAETYAYSADGMRETKATGSGTVHYVRDGENVLSETDGTLATVAQHTDLPGMWGGKFAQRRSGASRFPVPDFQGNTRALLDATAAVTDTLITDAWGVELARTGVTADPFLAFGQWGYHRDAASRLYVRARHLRVDQGRWVSRDPIGFDGGDWNLYLFVGARTVQAIDPDGRQHMTILPFPGGSISTIRGMHCDVTISSAQGSCNVSYTPHTAFGTLSAACDWLSAANLCAAMQSEDGTAGRCCEAAAKYGVEANCVCGASATEQSWTFLEFANPSWRWCKNTAACWGLRATSSLGCLQIHVKHLEEAVRVLTACGAADILSKLRVPTTTGGKVQKLMSCEWSHEVLAADMYWWSKGWSVDGAGRCVRGAPRDCAQFTDRWNRRNKTWRSRYECFVRAGRENGRLCR